MRALGSEEGGREGGSLMYVEDDESQNAIGCFHKTTRIFKLHLLAHLVGVDGGSGEEERA